MQAAKNRASCSVNLCFLHMWYLKSPPGIRSMMRYKFSRSWNACLMLTINGFLTLVSSYLSLVTDSILFLVMILEYYSNFTLPWTSPSWRRSARFYGPRLSTLCRIRPSRSHAWSGIAFCWVSTGGMLGSTGVISNYWEKVYFQAELNRFIVSLPSAPTFSTLVEIPVGCGPRVLSIRLYPAQMPCSYRNTRVHNPVKSSFIAVSMLIVSLDFWNYFFSRSFVLSSSL